MKAAIVTGYGSPPSIEIREIDTPKPKSDELLIRIHASSVTSGDVKLRSLKLPFLFRLGIRLALGIRRPRQPIPGIELAGRVVEVGEEVSSYQPGDKVFGSSGMKRATNAEYICLKESAPITKIPDSLTYEHAASVSIGAQTALFFLRKADIKEGQKALIYGASGSVGTYAIQLAKYFGAKVIGVCSKRNMDLVKSLGADTVIDYGERDFATTGDTYDIIFDTVGYTSYSDCLRVLNPNGIYLLGSPLKVRLLFRPFLTNLTSKKKVISGASTEAAEDMEFLAQLIENDNLKVVIDKTYTLEEIAEAHAYVELGRKRGNVSILHNA